MARLAAMFLSTKRNKMKKLTLAIGFVFLLAACNNSADNSSTIDTVQTDSEQEEMEEATHLQESFPDLYAFLKKQDTSLDVAKFDDAGVDSLHTLPAVAIDEKIKTFSPYFIYNADQSLAIDLYSYNYIQREKEGKRSLEMAGPDSELGLINTKNNTRQRIFFSGPSIMLLEAKWMGAEELLLAGAEDLGEDKVRPMLWKINLADSTQHTYTYKDTVNAKTYDYTQEKLKEED